MKIQTRLSLLSSIIFGVIFLVIAALIYTLYLKNTERSIYANLKKTSYITALFYLEEDELNNEEFANIRSQFKEFVLNNYYQIYNIDNKISWGPDGPVIPADILDRIRNEKSLAFAYDDFLCYGIFYEDNQGDFVIVSKEKKNVITSQIKLLLWIIIASFLVGILAIIVLSKWMASFAYKPFSKVISQVKNISTNNLDVQIESPNTNDELQDLTDTFNDLLSKISETFIIQKNFVSYVSHEFKTPLASMLGNLEVFSIKDRSPDDYKQLSEKLITQIYQLEEILNTLIVISDLRKGQNVEASFRIDELVWEILEKINERYPNAKISVNIEIEAGNESLMTVHKDPTQILIALYNLIENAVKYSSGKNVDIKIFKENGKLAISISDKGIGIPEEQIKNISKPFYRAENTNLIQGSGIGLSIALRIIEKNKIKYRIISKENSGTTIILNTLE